MGGAPACAGASRSRAVPKAVSQLQRLQLAARLQLLQLFVDLLGAEFDEEPAGGAPDMDGRAA